MNASFFLHRKIWCKGDSIHNFWLSCFFDVVLLYDNKLYIFWGFDKTSNLIMSTWTWVTILKHFDTLRNIFIWSALITQQLYKCYYKTFFCQVNVTWLSTFVTVAANIIILQNKMNKPWNRLAQMMFTHIQIYLVALHSAIIGKVKFTIIFCSFLLSHPSIPHHSSPPVRIPHNSIIVMSTATVILPCPSNLKSLH